ncbi:heat shock 22 kDa protein, mitochondrial isoform X2 [Tanacetum coccineum]
MSSLTKLVASNIINRSLHCFTKNTNVHSNLFTRFFIHSRPALASRFFNTINYFDAPYDDLSTFTDAIGHDVFHRFSRSKTKAWISNRSSHPDSSNAHEIWPSRVEENDECVCLYLELPGVLEGNLRVHVQHNTAVIVGQGDKEFIAKLGFEKYICWVDLNCNMYKISDIKAEMRKNSGELKLTIPKLKPEEVRVLDVKVNFTD